MGTSVGLGKSLRVVFAEIAREAKQYVDKFNAQELTNTAWAFGTAAQQDVQLFSSFARTAERCLDEFSAQNLANTAWAFATVAQQEV